MAVDTTSTRWLGCVVCGDDSEFVAIADHPDETEVMCSRCGQARLVPVLAHTPSDAAGAARAS
jgi:hypothetical protein